MSSHPFIKHRAYKEIAAFLYGLTQLSGSGWAAGGLCDISLYSDKLKEKGNPPKHVQTVELTLGILVHMLLLKSQSFPQRKRDWTWYTYIVIGAASSCLAWVIVGLIMFNGMKSRKLVWGSQEKVSPLSACRISMLNASRQAVSKHCGNNKMSHSARMNQSLYATPGLYFVSSLSPQLIKNHATENACTLP